MSGPQIVRHEYTRKAKVGKWEVCVSPKTNYGYYEHDVYGEGGGLWFADGELADFDGRSCLPDEVGDALRNLGYVVSDDFY